MKKISTQKLTRAHALTGVVNVLVMLIIAFFFIDAFALLATKSEFVLYNLVAFSSSSILGGLSSLAICVGVYFCWLEYGIDLNSQIKENKWLKKPLLSLH
jgi:hypothetical protein